LIHLNSAVGGRLNNVPHREQRCRMKQEFKRQIVGLLDTHRIMTIATNRPDG
jgi:hypothetical protein